jgi:hypothetical protein
MKMAHDVGRGPLHCAERNALEKNDALAHDEKRILLADERDATTLRRVQSKLLHGLHG